MALVLRSQQNTNLTATQVDNNFTFVTASINAVISGSTPPVSASFALTASYALNGGGGGGTTTGSFTGSFTGSLFGTASLALTASYLSGYVSPFPFTGSAIISGSLGVTGSVQYHHQSSSTVVTPAACSSFLNLV